MNTRIDRLKGGLSGLAKAASKNRDSVSDTVILLSPDDCYVDGNPRTDFNDALIQQLAREFVDPNIGQKEVITVWPKDENGKHRIHHGGTRYAASQIAIAKKPDFKLRAFVDHSLTQKSNTENYWDQGSNNILRDNMSLRDRANFIGEYMDMMKAEGKKVTQAEIAERLGFKNASSVSRLLKLRNMSEEVRAVYDAGTEDIETLALLSELQKSNAELFNQLVKETELDRATVRRAIKDGELKSSKETVDSTQIPANENDRNFAHAQILGKGTNEAEAQEEQETENAKFVPVDNLTLKKGICLVGIIGSNEGFSGAGKTEFEALDNLTGNFIGKPLRDSAIEAMKDAEDEIVLWAKDCLSMSDLDDAIKEDLQSLMTRFNRTATINTADSVKFEEQQKTNHSASDNHSAGEEISEDEIQTPTRHKKNVLKAYITGEVNGKECQLLTQVSDELSSDKDVAGKIWVQVEGADIISINESEFTFKKVTYR